MLKIDLLFYFLEFQNSFSITCSKEFKDRDKLTIGKNYPSKRIQNVFSSESPALSEPKKSSFFLGKLEQPVPVLYQQPMRIWGYFWTRI